MKEGKIVSLDVREIPPWERHPKIFEIFDNLEEGETLMLINDHDPRPLHYEFMHEVDSAFAEIPLNGRFPRLHRDKLQSHRDFFGTENRG